jgi:4-amino-4-deoxy-L-arabinose transferase-like glycosyltransferase
MTGLANLARPGLAARGPTGTRLALFALYFASRLLALTRLPIFLDEAIHIRWSVFIAEGERLGRSWTYGKGLSIWLNALLFPWAFAHYLWASRALVALFGAVSLWACLAVGRRLFGDRVALLAGLLYVACPFALVHDRLALTDAPMAAFGALVLLASIRMAEDPRVTRALLVALGLALGVLAKATGVLLFGFPVAVVLCLAPREPRAWRTTAVALFAGLGLVALPLWSFVQTTAMIGQGTGHSTADLWTRLRANVPRGGAWLWTYMTPPLVVLALFGLVLAARERSRAGLLVALLVALPFLAFAAVSTLWYPRYLVVLIVPAVLLAAFGFERITTRLPKLAAAGLLALAIVPALRVDTALLLDPPKAAIPAVDRDQLVTGWPSGYGTVDTVAFVRDELGRHPEVIQVVVHSPSRRTTWRALGLEFAYEPRVVLRDVDVSTPGGLDLLAAWSQTRPTLLVVSPLGSGASPPDPQTWVHLGSLVARFCKPDGGLCDEVYRLCFGPDCHRPR